MGTGRGWKKFEDQDGMKGCFMVGEAHDGLINEVMVIRR